MTSVIFFAQSLEDLRGLRVHAIAGIGNHIAKFWTKRMRAKLLTHLKQDGDDGLDELPREAVRRLAAHQVAPQKEPPGGDAG